MPGNRARNIWRLVAIIIMALASNAMNAGTNDTPSGIEGTVTVSPIHGGPSKMGEPDSAPLANASLSVESGAGKIATITTDEKGHFKIALPAGRYAIHAEKVGIRGRGCGLRDIEVSAGSFKQVDLRCDTGMR